MDAILILTTLIIAGITLLALNISRLRWREKIGLGDGGYLPLKKAIRAHLNALEHGIPFLFIMYVLAVKDINGTLFIILAAAFLIARIVHALSYHYNSGSLRRLGAGVTYLTEIIAIVLALLSFIS